MDTANQTLIIRIFGYCIIIELASITILTAIHGYNPELITALTGLVMIFSTALATFLSQKNLTEKQEETLRQYHIQQHEQELTEAEETSGDKG